MTHSKKRGELTFSDFQRLAATPRLTRNEKIDFPQSYRKGYSKAILSDITDKLQLPKKRGAVICDIGCGCGDLALAIIKWAKRAHHSLLLVDSMEMLQNLPARSGILFPGEFPHIPKLLTRYHGKADAVICYSVLQYIYGRQDVFRFIGQALTLLRVGGVLLIGDIPNEDKRNRFLKTAEGKHFSPRAATGKIRDNDIIQILVYFRKRGFETYVLSQNARLPMASRREDIVIIKRYA